MRGKQVSCAVTGYRPQKLPWGTDETDPACLALKRRIRAAVEEACRGEMEHFLCGMAQGCDFYFAEAILSLKEEWPELTLEAAVPCPSQADGWGEADRIRRQGLLARCDMETMVQDHYTVDCMMRRNRYMVDHADLLLAVFDGVAGGTKRTVEYALRRGVRVVLISPQENKGGSENNVYRIL